MTGKSEQHSASIAEDWVHYFESGEGQLYQFSEGIPFLRRFIKSPFMQLPLHYTKLAPGSKVLEAGCGSGKFSLSFALMGHDVTSLDFSSDILRNIDAARRALEPQTGRLRITTYKADLEHLDLPDSQFDLVINEGVVEHWLDQVERRRILASMKQVTKPGGVVAVIIPNGNHPEVDSWIDGHPAFLAAPPMVKYTPALLRSDLKAIGLRKGSIDGITPGGQSANGRGTGGHCNCWEPPSIV